VQVCKWTTTIQGSLEPLCRLTHSIIQARRRRRVTIRSRSLVSTSNRALSSCADAKGEGATPMLSAAWDCPCASFSDVAFKVGDGFDVLVQVHVASAEVPARPALPHPVAHLLCNRQALRVVLGGVAEVPLRPIPAPKVRVRPALSRPVAHLLCNRQVLRVVFDCLRIVPLRIIRVADVPADTRCRGSRTPCPLPRSAKNPSPLQSPGAAYGARWPC